MENLDQTYKRLLSENKKEEKCKGCGEPISKCSCNTVEEALKGKQKKLDKNHNGKIDGQDLAIIRKEETEELQSIEEIAKVRSWRYDKNNPSIHSRTDHADTPETRNQLAKDIKANRKHNAGKIGVSSGMVRSNAKGATDSQKTVKLGPDNVQLRTYRGIAKSKMHKEEVELDESGAKHGPMSRARDLARFALNKHLNKHLNATYNEYNPEKDKLKKQHFGMAEEVQIDEANHREFASQGKMHPDMAKHMDVGSHMDYYEPKTGDKVHGKVMHKSDTEVHMKQTHDSYNPKKVGTVHKFAVTSKLDEQIDEVLNPSMGAGAYIDDFLKSKNPKFAGKSADKRRQMALAAFYAAKKGVKEEVKQIDEISGMTTRSYMQKARTQLNNIEVSRRGSGDENFGAEKARRRANTLNKIADKTDSRAVRDQLHKATAFVKEEVELDESEQKATPTVKTDKYSWGTMKTIHHGSSFSIPLHPEHHEHIAQMKDQQQHTIKTEDGKQYHVKREGDTVHFHGVNGGNKTSVPHKSLAEETQVDEAWVLRQKKKEKKPVKEENMISFKDFITEMEYDKNGRYVHKGKYGTSYDDPEGKEDSDKSTEKAEKRGRGRPAGAKSGARQIGGASKKGSGVEYTGYKLHLPNSNK